MSSEKPIYFLRPLRAGLPIRRINNLLRFVTFLLLVVGVVRMSVLVLHDPLLGYANQSDMNRVHYCFGVWPDRSDFNIFAGHMSAPINKYRMNGLVDVGECYIGSELLFAGIAVGVGKAINALVGREPAVFELHTVGIVHLLAFSIAAMSFAWLLRRQHMANLGHAVLFSIVIADPYNTLWFNTLYAEFAALFFAYTSVVLIYLVMTRANISGLIKIFLLLSLFFLGMSKVQHMLLPIFLSATLWLTLGRSWHWESRLLAAMLVISLITPAMQVMQLNRPGHMWYVKAANATDTYLGAVLPAMQNPQAGLRILDLPEKCSPFVGYTWYQQYGHDLTKECPELFSISRWRLLPLIASDLGIVANMLKTALPQTRKWLMDYLGTVENEEFAHLDISWWSPFFSVTGLVGSLNGKLLTIFYGAPLLSVIIASFLLLRNYSRDQLDPWQRQACMLVFLCGAVVYFILFISLFGDGYEEFSKHCHLAYSFLQVFWMFTPLFLIWQVLGALLTMPDKHL